MQQNVSEDITRLNQQQLDMLRLFQNPMAEQDYVEIKRFVVKTLAKNIDDEMERLEKEKEWSQDTYEEWGKEHMRTPYKK